MKKLQPSGYATAAQSRKPGYLAKRMAEYRKRLERENVNVVPLKERKTACG